MSSRRHGLHHRQLRTKASRLQKVLDTSAGRRVGLSTSGRQSVRRVRGRCKKRCWNRCRPLTEEDFGSLFSVSALEWYDRVSDHRQQATVIGSVYLVISCRPIPLLLFLIETSIIVYGINGSWYTFMHETYPIFWNSDFAHAFVISR